MLFGLSGGLFPPPCVMSAKVGVRSAAAQPIYAPQRNGCVASTQRRAVLEGRTLGGFLNLVRTPCVLLLLLGMPSRCPAHMVYSSAT